ncbi:hypothetical protein [Mycolicibacter hiberniae]|uniref:Uncharacterized protein n=1 Tax=Mycolicibacter hiberniae TaxID=29314 RepID=A0A7I7X623_9MYCO|nr:hypothetical protein [Mycolicibacter hiberniae]ORV70736.1 hypothetical protein AWC09_09920 [Mycolicibacter hiberniae]BBZ24307.1 hypothetical protein MHIB_27250 [Mycolicibacter hiberniae]
MSNRISELRDDLIMRSMLGRVGDIPETVLLPVLRELADDRAVVDAEWESVIARRVAPGSRLPARESWRRRYGQFVRELEWAISGLVKKLPRDDVERLVSDTVAARLRSWLRYLLPAFGTVTLVPRALYPPVMDAGVSVATFLVGPIRRTGVEPDGTLVYEIPECAMHTATEAGVAQEHSCLMACKAACEKLFDKDSAMPLEFEPHLPGLSCTLRVHPAASHSNR